MEEFDFFAKDSGKTSSPAAASSAPTTGAASTPVAPAKVVAPAESKTPDATKQKLSIFRKITKLKEAQDAASAPPSTPAAAQDETPAAPTVPQTPPHSFPPSFLPNTPGSTPGGASAGLFSPPASRLGLTPGSTPAGVVVKKEKKVREKKVKEKKTKLPPVPDSGGVTFREEATPNKTIRTPKSDKLAHKELQQAWHGLESSPSLTITPIMSSPAAPAWSQQQQAAGANKDDKSLSNTFVDSMSPPKKKRGRPPKQPQLQQHSPMDHQTTTPEPKVIVNKNNIPHNSIC